MDGFPAPLLTVDVVPLVVHEGRLRALLARRDRPPFEGRLALVGGFVRPDEDRDLHATAARVLRDKAGVRDLFVEQLQTFSGPDRDPRGWSASVAHFSLSPYDLLAPAVDAGALHPLPADELPPLPFDHGAIVAAAVARLRGKGAYSDLPARFLHPKFTLGELHATYQLALGQSLNEDAFRRKIFDRGLVEEVAGEKKRAEGATKPSRLYRLKPGLAVFDRRF